MFAQLNRCSDLNNTMGQHSIGHERIWIWLSEQSGNTSALCSQISTHTIEDLRIVRLWTVSFTHMGMLFLC